MVDEFPVDDRPKQGITTVTCASCGVAYIKTDPDGNEMRHFCELNQTLQPMPGAAPSSSEGTLIDTRPPTSKPPTVKPSSVKPPSQRPTVAPTYEGTLIDVSQTKEQDAGDTTQRRDAPQKNDGIPDDVRAAMRDPARLVEQYVLVKQIGKGGMGTVWKAWDRKLSRWVAIKFLTAEGEEDIERFNREARVAASLRHPNIAGIFEIGKARNQHFIAMEFVDGTSMDAIKVPLRDMVEMMRNVCMAIDSAHKTGIVHRDLKPQNVMVTKNGWPFVLDFGLAKQVGGAKGGHTLSVTGTIMGTPAYMPPEQAQGQTSKIDARSDVYSLGATLYYMLTKMVPFKGETPMDTVMKVVKEEPVDPRKHNAECPDDLATITLKAMEKEPERRYQTAAELAEDLRRWLADESILAKPPSIHTKIAKNFKRNKLVYALILTVVIALGGVGAVFAYVKGQKEVITKTGPDIEGFRKLWAPAVQPLGFQDYREGEFKLDPFDPALDKLKELPADVIATLAGENAKWFDDQAKVGEASVLAPLRGKRLEWAQKANKERLGDLIAWTKDVVAAIAKAQSGPSAEAYKDLPAKFSALAAEAAKMVAYEGQCTIRVITFPASSLKELTWAEGALVKDGKPVEKQEDVKFPDADLSSTPFILQDLEIRDYDLVLESGGRTTTVKIDRKKLANGKEFVISGPFDGPELRERK